MCIMTATSINIEQTFSRGRVLLSHVHNQLSVQTTCSLLCLGDWSLLGLVLDSDLRAVALLPEVDGVEEAMADGWDTIDD